MRVKKPVYLGNKKFSLLSFCTHGTYQSSSIHIFKSLYVLCFQELYYKVITTSFTFEVHTFKKIKKSFLSKMQKSKYVSWLFLCNSMHQFALLHIRLKKGKIGQRKYLSYSLRYKPCCLNRSS